MVLIILATVAINLTLGNNGIFNRAKTAKEQYQNAQDDENDKIAKYSNEIDSYIYGKRDTINLTKTELNEIVNNAFKSSFKHGSISIPSLTKGGSSSVNITFDTPLENNDYSVTVTTTSSGSYWSWIVYSVSSKTVNGFNISFYNNGSGTSGAATANWILVSD